MPYKSKQQWKAFFAMEARGDLPKGTARRWAHHTETPFSKLPKRKRKKASHAAQDAATGSGPRQPQQRRPASPGVKQAATRRLYELIGLGPEDRALSDVPANSGSPASRVRFPGQAKAARSVTALCCGEDLAIKRSTAESVLDDQPAADNSAIKRSTAELLAKSAVAQLRLHRHAAFLHGPLRAPHLRDLAAVARSTAKTAASAVAPASTAWHQLMGMVHQPAAAPPPLQGLATQPVDPGQAHLGPAGNSATNPIGTYGVSQSGSMSGFGTQNSQVMKGGW